MPDAEGKGELKESRVGKEDLGWSNCRGDSTKPILLIILLEKN